MLSRKRLLNETFTDGTLRLTESEDYIVTDVRSEKIPFGNRTVGIKRFFESRANGSEITKLVSIPLYRSTLNCFTSGDIVEVQNYKDHSDKTFYKIEQIQMKPDASPPCIYLSLTDNEISVTDLRKDESHAS